MGWRVSTSSFASARDTMFVFVLLPMVPLTSGFTSISQSKFGAELAQIQAAMSGEISSGTDVNRELGYLWTLPEDSSDDRGLGGGIAFAWDPYMFNTIIPNFHEDMFYVQWLKEMDLRAAGQRAFFSWSILHHNLLSPQALQPLHASRVV